MARQFIPKVTPEMVRRQPDQLCAVLNSIIDKVNAIE